ncbi:MAG: uL15 family ribosomal protein [Gemmataceae bacterium]|nr:uL15 family ribosomal protein [Gemmataceae bacterium]
MRWKCDETAKLRLAYVGTKGTPVVSGTFHAEIRRFPVMGFSPKRQRMEVRIWVNLDELPDKLPDQGISLYDGDRLLGSKDGWRIDHSKGVRTEKDSEVVIWLDD